MGSGGSTMNPRLRRLQSDYDLARDVFSGHPALLIAAIVGVIIGFGIWSLAEGGASTTVRPGVGSTPAKAHVQKTTSPPESHIEIIE
jgi:hypothetical protein